MIGTVADSQQFGNRQGRDRLVSREQPPWPIGDDPRALAVGRGVPSEPSRSDLSAGDL
jgi:hypothetical protein